MRRSQKLAAVLLTLALGATTMFAQRGDSSNNGNNKHSGARSSSGTTNNASHAGSHYSGGARGTVPTTTYQSPFNHQIHLNGPGAGCYNCGYGVYGGYAYSGYSGGYVNPAGPTATDAILANGGTFNNINQQQDGAQQPAPQAPPPQTLYIRPDYPTQYTDNNNASVNSTVATPTASASSDTPALLIFKDGTQMTIHNYAIYGTYIVVLTPERKRFPIAALDIAATQKANEAAGYELKLPAVFTSH